MKYLTHCWTKYTLCSIKTDNMNTTFKPTSRLARAILSEAFSIMPSAPNTVKFRQSAITDPHIQEIIKHTAEKTGVPVADIVTKMQQNIAKVVDLKKYSPVLYDTIAQAMADSAAFDLIEHSKRLQSANHQKFNLKIFYDLIEMVEFEHDQFFPLRAPGETNYIFHIDPILVPGNTDPKLEKMYASVGTAAATAGGHFIFNKNFMQKLMDYAQVEGLKPQGKKYQSNGGTIPDCYAYIEFLIMHELLHYTYGDFAHGKRLNQYSHAVHNWASDFRSNYMLVKNGYDQLPIGLFSDSINYDRQGSYDAMVKLVHDELAKLPKDKQEQAEKAMSDLDDHETSQNQSDEEAKSAEKQTNNTPTQDQIQKEVEEKLSKRHETNDAEKAREANAERDAKNKGSNHGKAGNPGSDDLSDLQSRQEEVDKIVPKMSWDALIRKMVSSSQYKSEPSYAQPHRRNVTGMGVMAQTGSSAVKPGDKRIDLPYNKLALIFDTSGSMYSDVPTVLANAKKLLTVTSKTLTTSGKSQLPIAVAFFAGTAKWFSVNIAQNYYAPMPTIADITKSPKSTTKPYTGVLGMGGGGGTDFSGSLAADCANLATQGYNILIFSDADVLSGGNWNHLYSLYRAHPSHVFFIANDANTFEQICRKLGKRPDTFSHL